MTTDVQEFEALADLEELEALAVGAITEPPPAKRAFPELPSADFDAELAPILSRLGLAMLRGSKASRHDLAALRRLAEGTKPHVREAARRILSAMKPRNPVTNTAALAQLATIEGSEVGA